MATKQADAAIREYLLFLENPAQLVDQRVAERLERRIETAADPLDRLIAIAEHERAIHPDEIPYRSAFITHAKQWATDHNVSARAFEQMGVASEVLVEAGLSPTDGARRSRRRLPKSSATSAGKGTSGSGVTMGDVKTAAMKLRGTLLRASSARL